MKPELMNRLLLVESLLVLPKNFIQLTLARDKEQTQQSREVTQIVCNGQRPKERPNGMSTLARK